MSVFQSDIEEIYAYFHINQEMQTKSVKTFMEIMNSKKGNVPGIIEEILNTRDLTAIDKLISVYALGNTIEMQNSKEAIERAIGEGITKGIEIGSQLPPGSSGKVEIIKTKQGIGVKITQDKPGDPSADNPGIAQSTESKPETGDPMYR